MSTAELTDWIAFEQVWGPLLPHERIDLGFAQVCYMLASLLGKPRRGREFKLKDFLPPWFQVSKQQDAKELQTIFEGWVHADNLNPDG